MEQVQAVQMWNLGQWDVLGGHTCSAMAKDQDIRTIYINFSEAFECPRLVKMSRSICAKKIEALWP